MPIRNPQEHTVKSVEAIVSQVESILAQLQVSKTVMELEPPMNSVIVEWQTSLDVGLRSLRTWADALRDAVDAKRLEVAVNGVSDSKPKRDKQRKKTP